MASVAAIVKILFGLYSELKGQFSQIFWEVSRQLADQK